MTYIFMDESGDLGFNFLKVNTSKNFIVTFLFVNNIRPLQKVVQKTFRTLPKKILRGHCGVLHSSKDISSTKIKLLTQLVKMNDFRIMSIRINKEKYFLDFKNKPNLLYNHIVSILLKRILNKNLLNEMDNINFIASQKETNKYLNNNFKKYLNDNLNTKYTKFNIQIKKPHQEKGLQIVDCLSWSLFRKYEYLDEIYYDIFKEFIVEDGIL